jgi:hypothetical protein
MPDDHCTRCHRSRSDHEDTLLGCICAGRDWWTNHTCKCEGFVEPK